MAGEPLDALRLALMQDVLPVGLAVVERVRRGGPREVMAAFEQTADADPLGRLRQEGEPAARQVRENLDRLQPGLGNPVVKVSVRDVPETPPSGASTASRDPDGDPQDPADLQQALARIAERLTLLERRLLPSEGTAGAEAGPGA